MDGKLQAFLTSPLDRCKWSTSCPRQFVLSKRIPRRLSCAP